MGSNKKNLLHQQTVSLSVYTPYECEYKTDIINAIEYVRVFEKHSVKWEFFFCCYLPA